MNIQQRRPGLAERAVASVLALSIVAGAGAPAQAQRRRGEPEANSQFQQQLQSGSSGGGAPIDGTPAVPLEAPSPGSALEAQAAPARSVQGVQIGTLSSARPSPAAATAPLETRVTVRVKGAPLATFLDTISAQAKVNFIITEGLESKRVTAFLQNVTVREALQVLLEIKGLTYQQIGKSNTYVVAPRSKSVENLITRIYTLNYIPLIPLGDIGADMAAITPQNNMYATAGGAGQAGAQSSQQQPQQGQGVKESAVAIINVLSSVLSKNGHVAIEPRTNSLVVTDVPEVFPQVEQIIAELDRKPPQVMIEAQIVEIDSTRARDIGFEWGGPNGELASFTGGRRDTSFPMSLPAKMGNAHFFDPVTNVVSGLGQAQTQESAATGGAAASIFGSNIQTSILDLTSLQITLRALVSRSEARFLGKPKILTLNNKPAIMQIASNQAVGFQINQSGGSSVSNQVTAAERVTTGLILKVTPQVNKEGYITMLVQPSFTDVQQSNISTARNPVWDPISRGASTLVRVRNGQTLVMGGLLRSTETKAIRKVPILGYIPIIGWFFTSSSSRRNNSDLVIFLTPTIVSD